MLFQQQMEDIFFGYTWSYGNEQQVYAIKTDFYGNVIWEKNYGGTMWEVGNSVIELSGGGYAIVGFSNSPGISSGNTDVLLIKIDESGNEIWMKAYGNIDFPNQEWGNDIVQINDNGFLIVGSRDRYNEGGKNSLILRLDVNGELIWEKELTNGEQTNETAYSISAGKDEAFYICLSQNSLDNNKSYNPSIIKIDSFGTIYWQKNYKSDSMDYHEFRAYSTLDNQLLIVGSTVNKLTAKSNEDAFISRIDSNGKIIWTEPYGSIDNDDWGWSVHEKPNGNIIMIGSTKSYGSSLYDIFF